MSSHKPSCREALAKHGLVLGPRDRFDRRDIIDDYTGVVVLERARVQDAWKLVREREAAACPE